MAEHEAIEEVLWSRDDGSLCKSVLLVQMPMLEVLSHELELVSSTIDKMIEHEDDRTSS